MCKTHLLPFEEPPDHAYFRAKQTASTSKPRSPKQNSEKRKEKSRDAARCRRGKESEIFNELAENLPLPQAIVAQLDKASIMRLALAFLKTRALHTAANNGQQESAVCVPVLKCEDEEELESKLSVNAKLCIGESFLKTLDGFVLIVSGDTDVVFTSENIQQHLGLPQVDVMGNSLLDYAHPCDHAEIQELVSPKGQTHRHYFIRLKCTLTQKGRNVNLKSATYKVCQISGKMVTGIKEKKNWVVATASPVPHPANVEFPLDKQAFVSKHSLDMKFTYVDDNIAEFMGYEYDELVGRSLYEMNHAEDSQVLKNIYKFLYEKGQVETPQYRFLARGGGYVWLVTQATLINGPKGDKQPQYVVCINYVVSGIEEPGCILSSMQLAASPNCAQVKSIPTSPVQAISDRASNCEMSPPPPVKLIPQPILPRIEVATGPKVLVEKVSVGLEAPPPTAIVQRQSRPQRSTSKIFTRRTEDMTKGYLMFSKDDPQKTVLKEEPDDITHLAPSMSTFDTPMLSDYGNMYDKTTLHNYQNTYKTITDSVPVTAAYESSTTTTTKQIHKQQTFRDNHSVGQTRAASVPVSSTMNIFKPISSTMNTRAENYPRSSTASIFCQLSSSSSEAKAMPDNSLYPNSHSESMMALDEEDMCARAPYIPLCDELLLLGPDDIWDSTNDCNTYALPSARYSKDTLSSELQEDPNLAKLLRDIDPTLTGGTEMKRKPSKSVGQPNGRQNNSLEENCFVDPNKVLPIFGEDPGDFSKSEPGGNQLFHGYGSGPSLLVNHIDSPPPPFFGERDLDKPPPSPAYATHQAHTGLQRVNSKRVLSPTASPIMAPKRMCSSGLKTSYSQQQLQQQGVGMPPLLPVPNAPTMHQLLVPPHFKPGDPPPENYLHMNILHKSNLINRGTTQHDQSGRRVYLTHGTDSNNISNKDYINGKGVADVVSNKGSNSMQCKVQQPHPGIVVSSNCPQPSTANGNDQLHANRRLIAMRISQGRNTSGGQPMPSTPLHLATNCSYNASYNSNEEYSKSLIGGASVPPPVWRQGLAQLTDPGFNIPNLSDLTQQDYDVNTPATSSHLLQGSELIRALENTF